MKKNYYLFNPGRISRKENTLKFTPVDAEGKDLKPRYLPIEGVGNLYVFGSLDGNSAIYNFLGRNQVCVHFFDHYEHYTGSFFPKEYLLAGKVQIEQTRTYLNRKKRMHLARGFVMGAAFNMLKNLKYYQAREKDTSAQIANLEQYRSSIENVSDVQELMGIEGNCKSAYYDAFEVIIPDFRMGNRVKRPPSNEVNALISFGNMMCYTLTLDQIYHTQLNPTISFLHEPGFRRYSLALDLAEIFKPILADRTIFKVLNKKEIQEKHFDKKLNGCRLNDKGKQIFLKAFEERLAETITHRDLNRKVSYKHLVRLECYKINKYILGMESEYKPFKIWW